MAYTLKRAYMGLGTKHRQRQTAGICKAHLREKYPDKLELVEEFIIQIEGPPKSCDLTRWAQFTDIKDIKKEMLHRLENRFENWLNPEIAGGLDLAFFRLVRTRLAKPRVMKTHLPGRRKALPVYEFGTKTRYRKDSLRESYLAWHEGRNQSRRLARILAAKAVRPVIGPESKQYK